MSFIVIQHLSPDHTCMLPEILQHATAMPVTAATDNLAVESGRVYVIPPNKGMSIRNRTLRLHDTADTHGIRLPIDFFFKSLAEECGDRSIGVLLSGMGSDGTAGLRSIKEHGGLCLVQEPSSAKFDSMPKSAIDAGLADIIARPDNLPARIMDFAETSNMRRHSSVNAPPADQAALEKITALLKSGTKQDFSLYKPSSIRRRIERRMGIHKLDTLSGYLKYLRSNRHELDLLFKELLIGVTGFFRDPGMWQELETEALPKLLAAYPEGAAMRAWSCGCSTGEEPYSLAIAFSEAVGRLEHPERFSLQIFATDLDPEAVEKARRGLFSPAIEADVSPERLERFFVREDNRYRICREIREMITFAQQNVIMDPPFTKLDILICRNLLIYLSADLQRKLLPLFHYSLKPGGLLFLGSAETVGAQSDLFTTGTSRSKIFQRLDGMMRTDMIPFPALLFMNSPVSTQQETNMIKIADNLQMLADRLILQHFAAPSVLVNDQGDIVYISGRTGKYLEPAAGKANLNIFAMAREGLRYELGSAFNLALQQHGPVTVRATISESDSSSHTVDLTVMKIEAPDIMKGMLLIAFRDVAALPKPRRRKYGIFPDSARVSEMELELQKTKEELQTTREEMQSSHEELKSMNEELQSTNEELQSTNEELTTSKEEMQSMNEELQTVNAEQSERLEDYMRVSNDMENLLNSTEIVTVFLDGHLRVRRFTTGANRLFKLIPGDVGRPLTDIVTTLDYPELHNHVHDVLRKLVSMENHVPTLDGRWFLVRIMPYRTMDKMIDGVVITCNDITAAKKIEHELLEEITRLKKQIAG